MYFDKLIYGIIIAIPISTSTYFIEGNWLITEGIIRILFIIILILYIFTYYKVSPLKFKCLNSILKYENLDASSEELRYLKINTKKFIFSEYCKTFFNFEVNLSEYAKNNIKENKDCFTLIIEKAKTINIESEPNFFNPKTDDISEDRYIKYFYLFQEKSNPKKLQFNLKLNYEEIPDETDIKIFLEYGDKRKEVNDCNNDLKVKHKFKNEIKILNPIYENVTTNPPFKLD